MAESVIGPTPLVGRGRELDRLLAATRTDGPRRDGLLLVLGEAGMGKTRLLRELAVRAGTEVEVVWGRCSDRDDAPALWPWVQVLRSLGRRRAADQLAPSSRTASIVARVVPDLAERLEAPGLDTEPTSFEVVDALAESLLHVATTTDPVLVLLDDVHWADPASLDLLGALASRLDTVPLTVVATTRPTGDAETLSSLAASADVISLRGLDATATDRLATASGAPRHATGMDLHRRTGGNPFYVLALAASTDDVRGDSVPMAVRGLVDSRIAALDPAVVTVLNVTAVLGTDVDEDLVGAVCGRPATDVLDDLKTLDDLDLVERDSQRSSSWRIAHDLLRDAVLARCGDRERRELEAACAGTLADRLGDDPSAAARLAHHHVAALPLVERPTTVHWLRLAAQDASRRLGHAEAARHLQTAVALLRLEPEQRDALVDTLLDLAAAQARATGPPSAKDTWDEAGTLARQLHRPEAFARAVLGTCQGHRRAPGFFMDTAGELDDVGEALDLLGEAPSGGAAGLGAQLQATRALHLALEGRAEEARVAAAEARSAADATGDPYARALAAACHRACLTPGSAPADRAAATAELRQLAVASGDRELEWRAHRYAFTDALVAGDPAGAARAVDACLALATQLREPYLEALSLVWQGTLAVTQGRFEDHAGIVARAQDAVQRAGGAGAETLNGQQLYLGGELGTGDASVVDGWVAAHPAREVLRALRAWYHLRTGSRDRARELLREVAAAGVDTVPRHDYWLAIMAMTAELAARLDDRATAATLLRLLATVPDQCVLTAGAPMAWPGPIRHVTGLLRLATGDATGAAVDLRAALAIERRMGARLAEARTRTALAASLLEAGDRRAARAEMRHARDLAREFGMVWLCAEQEPLLEALDLADDPGGAAAGSLGAPAAPVQHRAILRASGATWQVGFEGRSEVLPDSKGLGHLAQLLAAPNRDHDAIDLVGDPSTAPERARVNVTRALRTAIAAIGRVAPDLADHLSTAVQTGRVCTYRPDPTSGITWSVEP